MTFTGATAGSFSYNFNTNTVYVWCSDNADHDTHAIEVSHGLQGITGYIGNGLRNPPSMVTYEHY